MLQTAGFRLTVAGAVVFLVSLIGLLFLPDAVAAFGLLVGGVAVFGGFIWTLLEYYISGSGPPPDA